jgi:hypothetical protein
MFSELIVAGVIPNHNRTFHESFQVLPLLVQCFLDPYLERHFTSTQIDHYILASRSGEVARWMLINNQPMTGRQTNRQISKLPSTAAELVTPAAEMALRRVSPVACCTVALTISDAFLLFGGIQLV